MSDIVMADALVDDPMDWAPTASQRLQHRFDELKMCSATCVFVGGSERREDDCPICLQEISETDLLIKEMGCQHTFCPECFFKGTKSTKQCPVCRRSVLNPRGQTLDRISKEIEKIEWEHLCDSQESLYDHLVCVEHTITQKTCYEALKAWERCDKAIGRIRSYFENEIKVDAIDNLVLTRIEQILIDVSAKFENNIWLDRATSVSEKVVMTTVQHTQIHYKLKQVLDLCS